MIGQNFERWPTGDQKILAAGPKDGAGDVERCKRFTCNLIPGVFRA